MIRKIPYAIALLIVVAQASDATADPFSNGRWIDLTHEFSSETVYWPTERSFELETRFEGYTDAGYYYMANRFSAPEHGGTHMDAPIHFAEGRRTVAEVPLEQLIGNAVVVDVSEKAARDRDYQVNIGDFEAWEAANGPIPDGAIVLLDTGFGRFWPDRVRYMGTDERGEQAVAKLHFPGLHPDAARWLASERGIKAVGLDTPSIDYGQSRLFESHRILFDKNIPAFENLANLGELPSTGASVVALPMKIRNGSGAPLRIVAFVPKE